ncbi:hypothetical protein NX785_00005, partial [Enterobacter huaxiensis]|uniref:hypothetical protein n=1 Tax=Enterobacter huaxiensis TaxID=2494702 RepID=UPI0021759EF1
QKAFNHLCLSVVANVLSLRQMPDTSYQLARLKVIGYNIGVSRLPEFCRCAVASRNPLPFSHQHGWEIRSYYGVVWF